MRLVLLISIAAFVTLAQARGQSPATELAAALVDLAQLHYDEQLMTRYLSLYSVPENRRDDVAAVVSYTLNALSRSRAIVRSKRITDTLIRFDIEHYTTNNSETKEWLAAWEKIVEVDPYWHIRTEVLRPKSKGAPGIGQFLPGARSSPTSFNTPRPWTLDLGRETIQVTIDAGWIDLAAAARLKQLTASGGAILRADHFIAVATVPPRYYEFAGVAAKEADFLKSLGVDAKKIEQLRANAGANLIHSAVTFKPRRIIWQQGPLGGAYSTLDVERVAAERDPLRRPLSADGLALEYDASEWFAMRANGLWLTALFNRGGQRQDSVPERIAKDTSDPAGDGVVVPMLSCIRCHREAGLRPFSDDQHALLTAGIELRAFRVADAQRVAEFYDEPRLQRQIAFDRETYSRAVARATDDMRPQHLADALAATVREFAYKPVTPDQAARELGIDAESMRGAFASSRDPILLLLARGHPVLRGQWESSFAEAAVLVGGSRRAEAK